MITKYIIAYAATLIVFLILDMAWLAGVAREFYAQQLKGLMGDVRWGVALLFYSLYVAGIVIFAVRPGLETGSLKHAFIMGALFGFFCYATYDLTNLATLKNWPQKMVYVDIVWGTLLTGSCALAGTWLTKTFIN